MSISQTKMKVFIDNDTKLLVTGFEIKMDRCSCVNKDNRDIDCFFSDREESVQINGVDCLEKITYGPGKLGSNERCYRKLDTMPHFKKFEDRIHEFCESLFHYFIFYLFEPTGQESDALTARPPGLIQGEPPLPKSMQLQGVDNQGSIQSNYNTSNQIVQSNNSTNSKVGGASLISSSNNGPINGGYSVAGCGRGRGVTSFNADFLIGGPCSPTVSYSTYSILEHGPLRDMAEAQKNNRVCVYDNNGGHLEHVRTIELDRKRRSDQLFVVHYYKWDSAKMYPYGYVSKVIKTGSDLESGKKVLNLMYQVPPQLNDSDFKIPTSMDFNTTADGRIDYTKHHVISIDPPGCQDIDDALSVREIQSVGPGGDAAPESDQFEVGIHIADVTAFEIELYT